MNTADLSLEHQVALLSDEERAQVLADMDLAALEHDWAWNGRPSQVLPAGGDAHWTLALALAGRGFG